MQIIDAHFHMFPEGHELTEIMERVGHKPGFDYLRDYYKEHDFVHGVIMSNGPVEPEYHCYPEEFHYCIGLDDLRLYPDLIEKKLPAIEENLRREQCCGIKLYPGYTRIWLNSDAYKPIYELAEIYNKPVAIHMGQTAHPDAQLKYSHPLQLDEVAAAHPYVQFVMCHFGNPFLPDAAAVVEKNGNVAVDLSGLLEGITPLASYFEEQAGYIMMLKGWIAYVNSWDRFMFGTDYPAVNLQNYVDFCRRLIPEKYWPVFFYGNANRIYNLGLH